MRVPKNQPKNKGKGRYQKSSTLGVITSKQRLPRNRQGLSSNQPIRFKSHKLLQKQNLLLLLRSIAPNPSPQRGEGKKKSAPSPRSSFRGCENGGEQVSYHHALVPSVLRGRNFHEAASTRDTTGLPRVRRLFPVRRNCRRMQFNRDIRPILAQHCFKCHGTDMRKAGLSLLRRESVVGRLKSGQTAIVPGHSDQSELIARVTLTEGSERMPPKGERLTPDQVARLRAWIDQEPTTRNTGPTSSRCVSPPRP